MRKEVNLIYIVALLLFSSCEEKVEGIHIGKEFDLIVVEGVITNEKINHKITLSRPYGIQNGTPIPVSVDTMVITDGIETYSLKEIPQGSGHYYAPPFRAVFAKRYFLLFLKDGKEYIASDYAPVGQPLDDLQLHQVDSSGNYYYSIVLQESGSLPNYVEYDINWEDSELCNPQVDCFGKMIYYDLKNIDVHEIYKPEKEEYFFPQKSRVIRKKYSVSNAYQTYLRSILSETEWRGGMFDIERANAASNLSEGAIGFFAVSTVVTDTILVE